MRVAKTAHMTHPFHWRIFMRLTTPIFLTVLALEFHPLVLVAQTASACADTSGIEAKSYRATYGMNVSSTDTSMVGFRARTGLPTLASNQVILVSDTTVCRAASTAFDAQLLVKHPANPVVVLQLGTKRMVIKDVGMPGGWLNMLFDSTFATLYSRILF